MKHWCYYSRVVAYLEKMEALFPDKTHKGAYLLWRDDDGNPLMIAGPGVDWFQGRGPMPDLNNLGSALASPDWPLAANPRIVTAEAWTEVHGQNPNSPPIRHFQSHPDPSSRHRASPQLNQTGE